MARKEKIIDLPSYSKARSDIQGANTIGKIVKLLSFFGVKNKKLNEAFSKISELKKQIDHLSSIPDKFNSQFAKSGWIAHESMNSPLMEKAVFLAENGEKAKAEIILAEHFTSTQIEWLFTALNILPEFAIRNDLIRRAYQDTLEKRYYSSVPLLLLLIDGIVNDISRSKGFFTENTDLTAWDSIAAHATGLMTIKEIFNSKRNKTNQEEIFLPYRNGILHGRDLKYDNQLVTGKCWSTLFAINDWATALKNEKKTPPISQKKQSLREVLKSFKTLFIEHQEWKVQHDKLLKEIEEWKPRNIETINLNPLNFNEFSPEKQAYDFGNNWLNKNYGKIALQIYQFDNKEINMGKEAGRIRSELNNKTLREFKIIQIKDEAPAISEIVLDITYINNSKEIKKEIVLRLICKSENGGIGINGQEKIIWKFIDNVFYKLDI